TTLLPDFAGHLVTDYNAAYNQVSSKHQRCWSHLVRALHALKTDHRVPGLDADNNRAERLLRPLVIGRKISGGTRSPAGTAAHMGLSSLFATWQARRLNPFHACLSLLHSRLPQT